ncbi:MAG: hypothetical protein O7G83_12295 [Proteobacteria bacterium]|nr:hypothetical protein [Pseudomonadota bacterium]
MVARYAGASLGLLAFAVTVSAGLFAQNSVEVTLSRSILSLFVFFGIGTVLGMAAQRVITEHEEVRENAIRKRYHEKTVETVDMEDDIPVESPDEGSGAPLAATNGDVDAQ